MFRVSVHIYGREMKEIIHAVRECNTVYSCSKAVRYAVCQTME